MSHQERAGLLPEKHTHGSGPTQCLQSMSKRPGNECSLQKAGNSTVIKRMAAMNKVLCLLMFIPLVGCAAQNNYSAKYYAEMELRYALPFSTDHWQHSDRSWQCEQPQIGLQVGLEWPNGFSAGLYHESMLLCGTFNSKPEIYENGITLKKKWGGYK